MEERRAYARQATTMRSSVAWALLGLVIERPSYGWELVQRFSRTYGDMVALSTSKQIYTGLDALIRRSLIEEVEDPETRLARRRPKTHYRATHEGICAYEEWLLTQLEEERQRSRLFARQLAMLEPQAALDVLDEYERECLVGADETSPAQNAREVLAERLVEGEEQTTLELRLSWIKYARSELEALIAEGAEGPIEG